MLGSTLPTGTEAITFQNTLFRVSELCWVKAVSLSIPELVVRVLAGVLAVAWAMSMASAKSTGWYNVEWLLACLPLVMVWTVRGSLKVGSTGDFEDSYDDRWGLQTSVFKNWIGTLKKNNPDWFHLTNRSSEVLINPNRVAWVRPCYQFAIYPLIVAGSFMAYLYLIGLEIVVGKYPVIEDFQILAFEGGTGSLNMVGYAIVAVSLLAFVLSIKKSVEIRAAGGIQDVFAITSAEQARLLNFIAQGGRDVADSKSNGAASPVKKAAAPVKKPAPAKTAPAKAVPVKPDPVKEATAQETTPRSPEHEPTVEIELKES